jgi:hypothetical protein
LWLGRWTAASSVVKRFVFIVVVSIVVGGTISFLTSSESISEQKRDELVRKSDDQSWRV